ncbi:RDD family protein [Pontibacter anaerobius]|uniref:RDD family protein n=1 Tax=Pontibacter anaerobius TaxID=2993940 RepID=A0ABT3RJB2_9BACT|nr:RDD family protein [Pontibacter anaerobius]MCX2741769.1 RDD family protein [Pontibacter anaerobius]
MQSTFTLSPAPTVKRSALYGTLSARFVSFLVDTTLLVFFYTFIVYGLNGSQSHVYSWDKMVDDSINLAELMTVGKMVFLNPFFPIIHWAYYTFLESSNKQATIGKFTLGLRVTDLRGKPISFAQANLRYFSKLLSLLPLGLGFVLMVNSRRHQMLHDYLARALVVNE